MSFLKKIIIIIGNKNQNKIDKHNVTDLPQSEDWAPLTQTQCEMIKVVEIEICLVSVSGLAYL